MVDIEFHQTLLQLSHSQCIPVNRYKTHAGEKPDIDVR